MKIYIVTLSVSVLLAQLAYAYGKKPEYEKELSKLNPVFIWLLIAFLVFISGSRYMNYYQSDEWIYRTNFDNFIGQSFQISKALKIEGGNYIFTWILANIFKNSQAYIIFSALITNILIIKTLEKYARPFTLAVFLYITGGFYFTSMNIIRQYIAISIIFYGLTYIINKKFWKYMAILILASSFHYSALILFPLYFVLKREQFSKNMIILFVITIVVMINFDKIVTVILPGTQYGYYLEEILKGGYGVKVIRVAAWVIPYSILLIYKYKLWEYSYIKPVFINMILMSMCISLTSTVYVYVARFDEYFSLCALILIPKIPNLFDKRLQPFLTYSLVILFFLFGSYQMWISPQYHNIIFENISRLKF